MTRALARMTPMARWLAYLYNSNGQTNILHYANLKGLIYKTVSDFTYKFLLIALKLLCEKSTETCSSKAVPVDLS